MSSHRKNNACDIYDNDERYRDRERDRLHDDDDGCGGGDRYFHNNACHRDDDGDGHDDDDRPRFHDQGGRDERVGLSQESSQVSDGEATEDNGDYTLSWHQGQHGKQKKRKGGRKNKCKKNQEEDDDDFYEEDEDDFYRKGRGKGGGKRGGKNKCKKNQEEDDDDDDFNEEDEDDFYASASIAVSAASVFSNTTGNFSVLGKPRALTSKSTGLTLVAAAEEFPSPPKKSSKRKDHFEGYRENAGAADAANEETLNQLHRTYSAKIDEWEVFSEKVIDKGTVLHAQGKAQSKIGNQLVAKKERSDKLVGTLRKSLSTKEAAIRKEKSTKEAAIRKEKSLNEAAIRKEKSANKILKDELAKVKETAKKENKMLKDDLAKVKENAKKENKMLKDELIKEKEQLHAELAKVKEEVKEERKQSTEQKKLWAMREKDLRTIVSKLQVKFMGDSLGITNGRGSRKRKDGADGPASEHEAAILRVKEKGEMYRLQQQNKMKMLQINAEAKSGEAQRKRESKLQRTEQVRKGLSLMTEKGAVRNGQFNANGMMGFAVSLVGA